MVEKQQSSAADKVDMLRRLLADNTALTRRIDALTREIHSYVKAGTDGPAARAGPS